jgi:hypothetical protein
MLKYCVHVAFIGSQQNLPDHISGENLTYFLGPHGSNSQLLRIKLFCTLFPDQLQFLLDAIQVQNNNFKEEEICTS